MTARQIDRQIVKTKAMTERSDLSSAVFPNKRMSEQTIDRIHDEENKLS